MFSHRCGPGRQAGAHCLQSEVPDQYHLGMHRHLDSQAMDAEALGGAQYPVLTSPLGTLIALMLESPALE